MPARVTYWTGTWDPEKEGISKEVDHLRRLAQVPRPVVGFSAGNRLSFDVGARAVTLSSSNLGLFRALTLSVERCGTLTHVFGGLDSWYLLRHLGRRPLLLTAAVWGEGQSTSAFLSKIAHVAAECEPVARQCLSAGVPADRITTIHPGVDLGWYDALPEPETKRFTLLFASTPSEANELEGRGIPLLIELARLRPDIDILVLWRQWGDRSEAMRLVQSMRPTPNFLIRHEDVAEMRTVLANVHGSIVCFAPGVGKPCPNSVIESLACGRPVLLTPECGIADLVLNNDAGVVADRDVHALSAGVTAMIQRWQQLRIAARATAERQFSMGRFVREYEALYERLSAQSAQEA